jgi:hypothetical protein
MFDFQQALTGFSIRKGRSAQFADCGLGKTLMQETWAENVTRHTNGRVLILTPLAVSVWRGATTLPAMARSVARCLTASTGRCRSKHTSAKPNICSDIARYLAL